MSNAIKLINDEILKSLSQAQFNNTLIIDIREPSEYASEHIPGSINIPLDHLKKTDFSKQKDKIALFYCRLGSRTSKAQDHLIEMDFKEIHCLEGGLEQWKRCGLPTEKNKGAPIDIMRQIQIVAGSLVLLGIILAYLISPYFLWISFFVGAGLLTAGLTGFCGMAKLLMFLPWNKTHSRSTCKTQKGA